MLVETARGLGINGIVHTGHDATQKKLAEFGLMLPERMQMMTKATGSRASRS